MTPLHYHSLALRTAKPLHFPLENIRHAILGLCTEIGEAATQVKRHAIYGKELTPEMSDNLCEEIGDTLWYIPLACRELGFTFHDVCVQAEHVGYHHLPLAQATHGAFAAAGRFAALFPADVAPQSYIVHGSIVPLAKAELAALVKCLSEMAKRLGASLGELAEANIAKLRLRYPNAYTDVAAEARADKGGLGPEES